MADAGVPQTSGQTVKQPLGQSQGKPALQGLPKASPKKAAPAASAKDVSSKSADVQDSLSVAIGRFSTGVAPTGRECGVLAMLSTSHEDKLLQCRPV